MERQFEKICIAIYSDEGWSSSWISTRDGEAGGGGKARKWFLGSGQMVN